MTGNGAGSVARTNYARKRVSKFNAGRSMRFGNRARRIKYFRRLCDTADSLWTHTEVKWLSNRQIGPSDDFFRNFINIFKLFEANLMVLGYTLTKNK